MHDILVVGLYSLSKGFYDVCTVQKRCARINGVNSFENIEYRFFIGSQHCVLYGISAREGVKGKWNSGSMTTHSCL